MNPSVNYDEIPTFDAERYNQLCQDMGEEKDSETMIMMTNDYIKDAIRIIGELHKALGETDAPLFQRAAHTLKSTSAMFGAKKLSAMCKQMEDMGRANTLEDAAEFIALTEIELEKVKTKISA
jgi:HPt (histidine-containing phosphotransfer) domain-containing protein